MGAAGGGRGGAGNRAFEVEDKSLTPSMSKSERSNERKANGLNAG